MRIAVAGATGYAGSAVVQEAVGRGHDVVAVSRSAPTAPVAGATYREASLLDPASREALVADADVVVSALAPRGDMLGKVVEVDAGLAELAERHGCRLVVVGGFSSLRPAPGAPRIAEAGDLPPQFADEAREMVAVLSALEASPESLDWLFVSPAATFGAFAPLPDRGTYRLGGDVALFDADGESSISAGDFARAILDEVERGEHRRAHVGVAY